MELPQARPLPLLLSHSNKSRTIGNCVQYQPPTCDKRLAMDLWRDDSNGLLPKAHVPYSPPQELYADTIETDFGICVDMKNCAMVENFLDSYPEDEAPLTLSWLSSRWQESSSMMNRSIQRMPGFRLNNSRVVYQTMINYRRSLNLCEGRGGGQKSEERHRRYGGREAMVSRDMEDRGGRRPGTETSPAIVKAGPKKMWIQHYYLSNGNCMRWM